MSSILSIIPYKFYPPQSGGAMRCFYILREMALKHTVYLLTVQPPEEFETNNEPVFPANVEVISIYNKKKHSSFINIFSDRLGDALNYRFLMRSFSGDTNSYLLDIYPAINSLLKAKRLDIIYYENLEILGLLNKIIARKAPSSLHVYDAHNCDSALWLQKAEYEKEKVFLKYAELAKNIEQNLFKNVDGFFCCSKEDNVKLTALNKNKLEGIVIPNGVDTTARPFDNNEEKHKIQELVFCGSLDYFPNAEGLFWFHTEVFPLIKKRIPGISLTVIGNVSEPKKYEYLKSDSSVNFIGKVESVIPFYNRASVSIVPLLKGSGTRLKILEAMSLGNPVVSTSTGAEGIDFEEGKHILVANEPAGFAEQIVLLLNDKNLFDQVRADAYQLVESKYDWKNIGTKVNENLEHLLMRKNNCRTA